MHDQVVFLCRRLSYRLRNTPKAMARRKLARKSKNRVWRATTSPSQSDTSVASSNLIGREVKTSRGNKQWVASSLASQTPKRKKSGLVSLRGDDFVQDKSGKTLKRVSVTTTPKQSLHRRLSSLSRNIQPSSVKQYLARYVNS